MYIKKDIKKLLDTDLELKVEDSVARFLGVCINQNFHNRSINITHTVISKQIIEALDIDHIPRNYTP